MSRDQDTEERIFLCVFPFVGRPILGALFGMDDDGFAAFIEERKRELPGFFLRAIRPASGSGGES